MDILLHIVHALSALLLIICILLQQGKGATAGASFGSGGSQTMFGSTGSANFLSRSTAILAVVFLATSLALAWQAKNGSERADNTLDVLTQAAQEHSQQAANANEPAIKADSKTTADETNSAANAAGKQVKDDTAASTAPSTTSNTEVPSLSSSNTGASQPDTQPSTETGK